jgi:HSP20 family protein
MSTVTIEIISRPEERHSLLEETRDLLDHIRARAYELFEVRGRESGHEMEDWLQAERETVEVPSLDMAETKDEYQLQLNLPGYNAKDIKVAALPDAVIVEAESKQTFERREGPVRVWETSERKAFRRIPLPEGVDVDHVSASLDDGLLKVRAAKAEHEKQLPA